MGQSDRKAQFPPYVDTDAGASFRSPELPFHAANLARLYLLAPSLVPAASKKSPPSLARNPAPIARYPDDVEDLQTIQQVYRPKEAAGSAVGWTGF